MELALTVVPSAPEHSVLDIAWGVMGWLGRPVVKPCQLRIVPPRTEDELVRTATTGAVCTVIAPRLSPHDALAESLLLGHVVLRTSVLGLRHLSNL